MTMDTNQLNVTREEALAMWQKYKTHQHTLGAGRSVDREIELIYGHIAKGKVVIKAIESVVKAGLNEEKLPKLALIGAAAKECYLRTSSDGSASMSDLKEPRYNSSAARITKFPAGSFPGIASGRYQYGAIVPLIPPDLRPRRGLQNYHILFEAEWSRRIPVDPMLLRRLGKGDTWLVCGAWDLTEVERAVLQSRLRS